MSFADESRLFFKSAYGLNTREVPYGDAFCAHAVRQREILEIPDTLEDPRFARHPLVVEPPKVRFYAGAPLVTPDDHGLGTLCVLDVQPRKLDARQLEMLRLLGRQAMSQLELSLQAMRDPLTGLYNRRPLEETLRREIARARRKPDSIGVMAIDADHFKSINDNFGHDTGDAVLQAMAKRLLDCVREDDIVCRAGGEEFVIILPGMAPQAVVQRAERVRLAIQETAIPAAGQAVQATVSIGVAVFPDHGNNEGELLRAADAALYDAKAAGRNRVVVRPASGPS